MTEIAPLDRTHLPQVLELVNGHVGAAMPGWSLTPDYLWGRLQREPQEHVTDPWVVERRSIVGIFRDRVCAAAHLLRYGEETPWKGTGYIAWTLFWPEEREAGAAVMTECRRQMEAWQVSEVRVGSLPVPGMVGIPDVWPHINGEDIAECECISDLTEGGQLPSLAGWAELRWLETSEPMRNRGIGSWVVRHAVQWLRLARCDRIVVPVARADDQAGAGRFYMRFGWTPLVRERHWRRQAEG